MNVPKKSKNIRIDGAVIDTFEEWADRRKVIQGEILGAMMVRVIRMDPVEREELVDEYQNVLTGETPIEALSEAQQKTDQERMLLTGFRQLTPDQMRDVMDGIIRVLAKSQPQGDLPPSTATVIKNAVQAGRKSRQQSRKETG